MGIARLLRLFLSGIFITLLAIIMVACGDEPTPRPDPTPNIEATVGAHIQATLAAMPTPTPNIEVTLVTTLQAQVQAQAKELDARRREVQKLHVLLQTCLDYPANEIHYSPGALYLGRPARDDS